MASRGAARQRCSWVGESPLERTYHDDEWGVPVHDDRRLFEFLTLEGAQAGLSWVTILKKREGYRRVFDGFDFDRLARWKRQRIEEALLDPGIVRNRLKVESTVANARAIVALRARSGTFDSWLWDWVDGAPIQNRWRSLTELPAKTDLSVRLSRELKQLGFRFVGPTTCYAFMQAVGMVNDHTTDCFRWKQLAATGRTH